MVYISDIKYPFGYEDTPKSDNELRFYIEKWCTRYAAIENYDINEYKKDDSKKLKVHYNFYSDVYKSLDTLDNKSGALLQAASIIFGVSSINLGTLNADMVATSAKLVLGFSALSAMLSVVLCITVLHVKWIQVKHFRDDDYTQAMIEVLKLRSSRTDRYRVAHVMLIISMFLMLSSVCLAIFRSTNIGG